MSPQRDEKLIQVVNVPKEIKVAQEGDFDINKLAMAVSRHETGTCTLGTGKEYNNCFGIKNGNTAPCTRISKGGFCVYDHPNDSYEAFKKIWGKWYGELPTIEMAERWTGKDRAIAWRNNVLQFYSES